MKRSKDRDGAGERERVLTGKNTQWGSKPAYQLTSNQAEGKSKERKSGSHRHTEAKENIGDADRKGATGAKDKEAEKEEL